MVSSESKEAASRLQEATLSIAKFPQVVYLYHAATSSFKLHICGDDSQPLYLVSLPNGWAGELLMYAGMSKDAPPLAIVNNGGRAGAYSAIALAPLLPGQDPIREEMRFHGNGWSLAHTFAITVGPDQLPEKFEWRGSKGDEVKTLGERSRGWKLVRLGDNEEVVAVWADGSMSLSKAAKFQFLGSGASGELGEAWATMAVVTFLRLWQMNSTSTQT